MTGNTGGLGRPRLRLAAVNGSVAPLQIGARPLTREAATPENEFVGALRQLVGPACVRAFLDMFRMQLEALRRCPAQDEAQLVLQASEAQEAAAALGYAALAEACAQLQTAWRSGRSLEAARTELRRAIRLAQEEIALEAARGCGTSARTTLRLAYATPEA